MFLSCLDHRPRPPLAYICLLQGGNGNRPVKEDSSSAGSNRHQSSAGCNVCHKRPIKCRQHVCKEDSSSARGNPTHVTSRTYKNINNCASSGVGTFRYIVAGLTVLASVCDVFLSNELQPPHKRVGDTTHSNEHRRCVHVHLMTNYTCQKCIIINRQIDADLLHSQPWTRRERIQDIHIHSKRKGTAYRRLPRRTSQLDA